MQHVYWAVVKMIYLDPVDEYIGLADWIEPLIDQKITPKNLVRRLSRYLNKYHPSRVKLYKSAKGNLEKSDFTIGAEYDPELDQAKKKQFIINFIINHEKTNLWTMTADRADRFVLEMTETLVHEYQHQHQYRSRRYKTHKNLYKSEHPDRAVKDEQEYFGDPDEIDAYAANIAARIFLVNYKLNENLTQPVEESDSIDLQSYYRVFGKEHPVIDQLIAKIKQNIIYLKDLDDGKIRTKRTARPNLSKRDELRGWFRAR